MHIGRKIKKFRDENKLSQKEFAEKIGVTQGFLSHLENGRLDIESPSLEKKILIAIGEENKTDEITDDNNHDGIAKALLKYIPSLQ